MADDAEPADGPPRRGRALPAGAGRARRRAARGPVDGHPGAGQRPAAGAGGAATGWGKSAVYFTATALLRARGSGPSVIVSPLLALMRNQIDAAGRAGIQARTVNSANTDEWDAGLRRGGRGQGGRAAGQPGAAEQPRLPRPGAAQADRRARACWSWTRRTASPTGATTSGPTTGGCARCWRSCRPASRCWPPRPPPTRGSPATWPSSWRRGSAGQAVAGDPGAARPAGPGAACTWAWSGCPTPQQRLAWLAEHLGELDGLRHHLHADRRGRPRDSGVPARPRASTWPPTPARTIIPNARPPRTPCWPTRSRRWWRPARWAWASTSRTWGSSSISGAPQSPIAYYQQIGRAGPGCRAGRRDPAARPRGPDIWAYFASLAFPPEGDGPGHARRPGAGGPAAVHRGAGDQGRPVPRPAGDDAQGARRGRRGPRGSAAAGPPPARTGPTTPSGTPGWRPSGPGSSRPCSATSPPADCRMEYLRRELDDPAAEPCGRCDNCTGRHWPGTVSEAGRGRRAGPAAAARRRDHAAADVADRHGRAGHRRVREDRPRPGRRAGPGPGPADRPGLGPPAARDAGRRRRRGRRAGSRLAAPDS